MDNFIRHAKPEDKEEVLCILDSVYGGRDYLSSYYDNMLRDDMSFLFVAVCDGKIVSFGVFTVVDEGKTMVVRAARTVKNYQARGLQLRMGRIVYMNHHPGTTPTYSKTNASDEAFNVMSVVASKSMVRFELFRAHEVQPLAPTSISLQPLSIVTDNIWRMYITESRFSKYLFPQDRIVIDRVPFQLLVSNIPLFWQLGGTMYMVTDVRVEDGIMKGLLSTAAWFTADGQTCCNLDVFGTDLTSLQNHISSHIDFGKSAFPEGEVISLMVDYEETCDEDLLLGLLSEMGLKRTMWKNSAGVLYKTRITKEIVLEDLIAKL